MSQIPIFPKHRWIKEFKEILRSKPQIYSYLKVTYFTLLAICIFIVLATQIGVRYWIWPEIEARKTEIEAFASKNLGVEIHIGEFKTSWAFLRPTFTAKEITFKSLSPDSKNGQLPLLHIEDLEGTIEWNSLWHWSPHFYELKTNHATLEINRDAAGQWFIAGVGLTQKPNDNAALNWLLDENNLSVNNLDVQIIDEFQKTKSYGIHVEQFNLVNQGFQHSVDILAHSDWVTDPIILNAQFTHPIFSKRNNWHHWDGNFQWNIGKVNLGKSLTMSFMPIRIAEGVFSTQGQFKVSNGQFVDGIAQFKANDIDIFWKNSKNILQLKKLNLELNPSSNSDLQFFTASKLAWSLRTDSPSDSEKNLNNFSLGLSSTFTSEPIQTILIKGPKTSISELSTLAQQLPLPKSWLKALEELKPEGELDNFKLTLSNFFETESKLNLIPKEIPKITLNTDLTNVSWNKSYLKIPAVKNLSGHLFTELDHGSFKLTGKPLNIDSSSFIGRDNSNFDSASGEFTWHKNNNRWIVGLNDFKLQNLDIDLLANGKFLLPLNDLPAHLDLKTTVNQANIAEFTSYLPSSIPKDILRYLSGTLISGKIKNATLSINGDPTKIPFSKKYPGEFKFDAPIEQTAYRPTPISPKEINPWQGFDEVAGTVSMSGPVLSILLSKAKFKDVHITDSKAIGDFSQKNPSIEISNHIQGELDQLFDYISNSPVLTSHRDIIQKLKLTGNAQGNLKLNIPLNDKTPALFSIDLLTQNNQINYEKLKLGNINKGHLIINENGVELADLNGRLLDGPFTISHLQKPKNGLSFNGKVDFKKIAELILNKNDPTSLAIKQKLNGLLIYQGQVETPKIATNLTINADLDLKQVGIDLPAPINKESGLAMLGKASIFASKDSGKSDNIEWNIRLGEKLQSKGILVDDKSVRHGISLGNMNATIPTSGTAINFDIDTLDGDAWANLLTEEKPLATKMANFSNTEIPLTAISSISGKTKHLIIADRDIKDISISANHSNDLWEAKINSSFISGLMTWKAANLSLPSGELNAKFAKLNIPNEASKETITQSIKKSSRRIPKLDITADEFILGNRNFGALKIKATSESDSWKLDQLKIEQPNGILLATGYWKMPKSNELGQTDLKIDFNASNLGDFLKAMGYPKVVVDGTGELKGNVAWQGAPYSFNKETVSGDLNFSANKGKLLQVEPGGAKLLGLLSFQSLLKLATLNIEGGIGNAVSQGTYFDKISGTAKLTQGVGKTDDFEMTSSVADIKMSGQANLIKETQDLKITIYPKINVASTSLAAFYFINPIVGLSTLIGEYLITSSLNKALQADYRVQGSWQDPEVVPLDQKGQPIDPEILAKIKKRSLLKSPGNDQSKSSTDTPAVK